MRPKNQPALQKIAARVRRKRSRCRVLFTGSSKRARQTAARALARKLDLDLFRVDLGRVANKYIGETEKNLRRLFDAAQNSGAILFLDEADALFGKRSEVKDSHDRYANVEVSHLLRRIEEFRGLAIMSTNRKANLDTAFLRRFRFIIPVASGKAEPPRKPKRMRTKRDQTQA